MANRKIDKIPLSEETVRAIREKFSLRALAKKIKIGDRTIRYWLNEGEMPVYLWQKLLPIIWDRIPIKFLWMRVGVSFPVTNEEVYWLMKNNQLDSGGFGDTDIDELLATDFLNRGYVDGESYIPGCILEAYREWYGEEKVRRGED